MQIFVTGCASFIGRELLRQCKHEGIHVTGVDLVNTEFPGCAVADIRSPAIGDHIPQNVDAIVHLAALSRDPDCRDKAYQCFDVNVMGTLNLMEAARQRRQAIYLRLLGSGYTIASRRASQKPRTT